MDDFAPSWNEVVGLRCTNGTDLDFLSRRREDQSRTAHLDDYLDLVHPFHVSHGRFLNQIIADDHVAECYRLRCFCSKLIAFVRISETEETEEEGDYEYRDEISFRWNHPGAAMEYLICCHEDWGIPGFTDDVDQMFEGAHDTCRRQRRRPA